MKFEEKQPEPVKPNIVITLTHDEAITLHAALSRNSCYEAIQNLRNGLDGLLSPIPF